jgi:pseudouridine-5'-monophosphatase
MAPPAACLFDLDGLLLDTEPLHARAWQEAARHFGRALSATELLQLRGRRRLDCAAQVLAWIAADPSDGPTTSRPSAEDLLAVRQPIAERLLVQALPMPGAPELVQRCRQQAIPMALATSSSRQAVALKAAGHPWLAAITTRVYGDDPQLQAGKPAPDTFLLAAGRLGVDPQDCWAFEDSPAGARAAVAAGCRVHVLLPPGMDAAHYPSGVTFLHSLKDLTLETRSQGNGAAC